MKVWRVENAQGEGPFQGGWRLRQAMEEVVNHQDMFLYPDKAHDVWEGDSRPPYEYRFGCKSREQLDYWFPPEVMKLLHGYRVVVYEANEFVIGGKQVIFSKDTAYEVQ